MIRLRKIGVVFIASFWVCSIFSQSLVIGLPNGHKGRLRDISYSPNEKLVATSSVDKTIKVWDVETGVLVHDLKGHNSWIRQILFSNDGEYIISAAGDGEVKKWRISDGQEVLNFHSAKSAIECIALSPDGRRLYLGNWDGEIIQIDLGKGEMISKTDFSKAARVKDLVILPKAGLCISAQENNTIGVYNDENLELIETFNFDVSYEKLIISVDQSKVIAISDKGLIVVFKVTNEGLIAEKKKHFNGLDIFDATVMGETNVLGVICSSNQLVYYDIESNRITDSVSVPTHYYWQVISNSSGERSYLSTSSGDLIEIDNTTKSIKKVKKIHNGPLVKMVLSKDDKFILTASEDYTSNITEIKTWEINKEFKNHASWVESVALSKMGGLMSVTQFGLNECLIKESTTGRLLYTLKGHDSWIRMSDFSADGKKLVTASDDGTAIIWDLKTGSIDQELKGHGQRVESAYFSSLGDQIVTSSGDSTAIIWDVETGNEIIRLRGHTDWLRDAVFSYNGKMIASCGLDGSIRIWEATSGKVIRTLKGHKNWVRSVRFDQFGKRLLSASDDHSAILWDVSSGQIIQKFNGHTDWLRFARFHPDNQSIITGSNDRTIRVWNINDGVCRQILREHNSVIEWADFSADNQFMFTGSGDGSIIIWDALTYDVLLKSFVFDNDINNWLILHHSGLFDASPEAMKLMSWKKGLEIIGFEQLKTRYYEPNLWEKVLLRKPLRSVKGLSSLKLHPQIEIVSDKGGEITFSIEQRDGGIGNIYISINGIVDVFTPNQLGIDRNKKLQEITYDYRDSRHLKSSDNQIQISASSSDGFVKGRGARANVQYRKEQKFSPPHFYGVFIGVGEYQNPEINLSFSVTDAVKMSDAIEIGANKLFGKNKTHIYRLTTANSEMVSKEKILATFESIRMKSKPEDVLFIYMSGHGIAFGGSGDEGDFYYLTSQSIGADRSSYKDPSLREQHLVSTSELTEYLNHISALKRFIIIDACGSGKAVDKLIAAKSLDASQIKAIDRMRDRTGLFVLSGCASDAVSYEASQFGQGLLTYSILQGLKGGALFEGKFADVNTLMEYSRDKVPELAKNIGGIQTPQLLIPKGGSFSIGIYDESDKDRIKIANPKEVFVQSHFVNGSSFEPDWSFSQALDEGLVVESKKNESRFIFMNVPSYSGSSKVFGGIIRDSKGMQANVTLKRGEEINQKTFGAQNEQDLQAMILEWVTNNLK